jgi:3-oxoacyl-[acyl-carrier protein] reductase
MQQANPGCITLPADHHLVVVGGCGGIGHAIVQAAHAQRAHISVIDLPQSLQRRALPSEIHTIAADIRNADAVRDAAVTVAGRSR